MKFIIVKVARALRAHLLHPDHDKDSYLQESLSVIKLTMDYSCLWIYQWRRNKNTIGGAGMRGYEAADYPREASACEGQKLGGGRWEL